MNEATPPWRTFPPGTPEPPPRLDDSARPHDDSAPRRDDLAPRRDQTHAASRWLVPALAASGGAAAALAAALVAAVLITSPTPGAAVAGLGVPLDAGPVGPAVEYSGLDPAAEILVDVAGAVARPGLHRLRAGDRVGDALDAAGGFGPRADLAAASQVLNLAQVLDDGAKVVVPELGVDERAVASAADARIDINRAGQAELETLPGIGPVTARKIIDARTERPFGAVRDLRTREIVGQSVFESLKGLVRAD